MDRWPYRRCVPGGRTSKSRSNPPPRRPVDQGREELENCPSCPWRPTAWQHHRPKRNIAARRLGWDVCSLDVSTKFERNRTPTLSTSAPGSILLQQRFGQLLRSRDLYFTDLTGGTSGPLEEVSR